MNTENKILEWHPTTISGEHLRDTASINGKITYEVGVKPNNHYLMIALVRGGIDSSGNYPSVECAKKIAQADYEKRQSRLTKLFSINLPWPHKHLSRNGSVPWYKRAPQTKSARHHAHWTCMQENIPRLEGFDISIERIFSPPDRRHRDKTNTEHLTKAYEDGISDAIGVDDKYFDFEKSQFLEPVKNGNVKFIIRAMEKS